MSVAFVSFVKGATREEVYDFFRFLSRESSGISSETLPEILRRVPAAHILIKPLDYAPSPFSEDRLGRDGSDEYLARAPHQGAARGRAPADGVQAGRPNARTPRTLAVLMNQAGSEIAHERSYDTVVSSYLRSGSGRPLGEWRPPEAADVRRRAPPGAQAAVPRHVGQGDLGRPGGAERALEGVAVDSIIECFGRSTGAGWLCPRRWAP